MLYWTDVVMLRKHETPKIVFHAPKLSDNKREVKIFTKAVDVFYDNVILLHPKMQKQKGQHNDHFMASKRLTT